MKGHIRQRSPGHWAIVLDIRDETGKRRRKWHSFTGTKREAQLECARLISQLRGGTYLEPSKTTFAEYLKVAARSDAGSLTVWVLPSEQI